MVAMMPADGSLTTNQAFQSTVAFSTAARSGLLVPTDGGGSTRFLQRHRVNEDSFWTFDFTTSDYDPAAHFPTARNRVDWPVNLIFLSLADVNKAKSSIPTFSPAGTGEGSEMWARVDDERGTGDPRPQSNFFGGTWDHDRGAIKGGICSIKYHYRVYAPSPDLSPGGDDRMYNLSWGFYVVATSHEDIFEGCSWALHIGFSGNSEGAENLIARDARAWGLSVAEDSVFLGNGEDARIQARSHFKSNGYATTIQIP
jgi:hypothetical protein